MNLFAAGIILKTKQCGWHSLVSANRLVAQHSQFFWKGGGGLKF